MFALILSLAAPAGAVFASEAELAESVPSSATNESNLVEQPADSADVLPQPSESIPVDKVEPEQTVAPEPVATVPTVQHESIDEHDVDVTGPGNEPTQNIVEEMPLQAHPATGVVIVEIQSRGSAGANAELLEVYNASPDVIDVTGWCVQRASATGSAYTRLFCIEPEIASASTRVMLPGYASIVAVSAVYMQSLEGAQYDMIFSAGMADSGGRARIVDDTGRVIDLVGWGGATEFYGGAPASAIPSSGDFVQSLQRQSLGGAYQDTKQNNFDFSIQTAKLQYEVGALYEVEDVCRSMNGIQSNVPEGYIRLQNGECVERSTINFCEGLRVNEIAANVTRQYIELVNDSTRSLALDGCSLYTNRNAVRYQLPSITLAPSELYTLEIEGTGLTLTKSTTGSVYLLASDGETEVATISYADLSVETSWAYINNEWRQTYDLTPGAMNTYSQYPRCEAGYERNIETGRCRLVSTATRALVACRDDQYRSEETNRCRAIAPAGATLVPCKEGQYRSEETNRCRSLASFVSSLKPCADDQFRNPVTNRCKRIASTDDASLADCGEGRERNPTTNRCRNIVKATPTKADFAVQPTTQAAGAMWGWWALGGVTLLALGYAGWEWRYELRAWIARRAAFFRSKK